jgi:hypothetical protein
MAVVTPPVVAARGFSRPCGTRGGLACKSTESIALGMQVGRRRLLLDGLGGLPGSPCRLGAGAGIGPRAGLSFDPIRQAIIVWGDVLRFVQPRAQEKRPERRARPQ